MEPSPLTYLSALLPLGKYCFLQLVKAKGMDTFALIQCLECATTQVLFTPTPWNSNLLQQRVDIYIFPSVVS